VSFITHKSKAVALTRASPPSLFPPAHPTTDDCPSRGQLGELQDDILSRRLDGNAVIFPTIGPWTGPDEAVARAGGALPLVGPSSSSFTKRRRRR